MKNLLSFSVSKWFLQKTKNIQQHFNPSRTAKPQEWLWICPVITLRPIELESCSNPLRIRQVFLFWLKNFFYLDLFFCGDVTTEACFRTFVTEVTWAWVPTQRAIPLVQVFLDYRLLHESVEALIVFLEYLEPKLRLKD